MGKEVKGVPSGLFVIDTGEQCTIGGAGDMYDDFLANGRIMNYTGYGEEPVMMFDKKNYHTASCRLMKFDETYYQMPYDCRSRKLPYQTLSHITENIAF